MKDPDSDEESAEQGPGAAWSLLSDPEMTSMGSSERCRRIPPLPLRRWELQGYHLKGPGWCEVEGREGADRVGVSSQQTAMDRGD